MDEDDLVEFEGAEPSSASAPLQELSMSPNARNFAKVAIEDCRFVASAVPWPTC